MNNTLIKPHSRNIAGRSVLSVRDRADALRYEASLVDFTAAGWRFVEPKPFQSNWHIDAICEHLRGRR